MDRLEQDRKLMLFQHLGFVHCPIREHCPAFPNCIDALIERVILSNNQGLHSHSRFGQMQLNLVIIGLDYASSELISKVHNTCNDNGEYVVDGCAYTLNIETINRENDYSFAYDFHSKGIICAFSNRMSFRYVNDVLEKQIFNNLEFKNDIDNLHIILVNDIDKNNEQMDLNELNALRDEAQQLAERLGCLYIDRKDFYTMTSQQNEEKFVETILNNMIEIIPDDEMKLRDSYNGDQPDIRIILSMFCGDPYNVETIVSSLMSEPSCVSSDDRHITFELFLGDSKRRVEVILSSYHGANSFRDELIHGFILLYSTKRKASLATLNAFSMNIPNLPMQMVALTEPGGVTSFFNSELCQILITEGNSLADKLRAHFATASDEENQFKCKFYYFFCVFILYNHVTLIISVASYAPFLKEVWDKKPEIEHAFQLEEPLTIDSGEGTMEHSVHHHQAPAPPPRFESYLTNGSFRQQFERSGGQNPNGDPSMYPNMYLYDNSEQDDRNSSLHKGFQMYSPPNTPPEPAPPDHLLTPSSILRQLKEGASQSSLEEINCKFIFQF